MMSTANTKQKGPRLVRLAYIGVLEQVADVLAALAIQGQDQVRMMYRCSVGHIFILDDDA